MKNQYFGDVNDYLKYGLLRCFANAGLRIGVCWMLTPDDGRSDGRKIRYLSSPDLWRSYDPALFDILAEAVRRGSRRVGKVQTPTLFPTALFCDALVPDRQPLRKRWLTRSLSKLEAADLLFFDPDNGIEVPSKPMGRKGSSKYFYWDEIETAWARGCSLLIFQHFARKKRRDYILRLSSSLVRHVPGGEVVSLVTKNVLYLLAYHPSHEPEVGLTLQTVSERWVGQIWRTTLRSQPLDGP
jgi:hypothetical protein